MAKKAAKKLTTPKTARQYDKMVATGDKYYRQGHFNEALKYFSKALEYKEYAPNLLVLMARCLFNLGMKNKAIHLMEHALHQSAGNSEICETLGHACISMDLNDIAVKFFQIYIQLLPDEPIGYNNLATALRENGQVDESIELLQSIIPLFPTNIFLWNSVAAAVSFRDGYPSAQPFYEEAYRIDPDNSMVVQNLSLVYLNLGQYKKAWEFAKKAVKLSPNDPVAHRALAHSSYNLGEFEQAAEAMKWHNHPSDPGSVFMPYDIPTWKGEDLTGKTILIGAEQGVGDEIFFSALYPQIIKEAKKVIIGCDARLVPLFSNSFKDATILGYTAGQSDAGYRVRLYEGLEEFDVDYMCLYSNILMHKWTSIEKIPDMSQGFLNASEDKIEYWKDKIEALNRETGQNVNVGLCWRSGLSQAKRSMFYASLVEWEPVLKTKNINFINVQYGDCREEIKELFEKTGVILHNFEELDLKDDFEGSAALMKNLDLVIGPGTTPVSQAACTGTRAWWVNYNHKQWWSFGQDIGTPVYKSNKMSIKPSTLDWNEYLPLFAQEEFAPWAKEKAKEKK